MKNYNLKILFVFTIVLAVNTIVSQKAFAQAPNQAQMTLEKVCASLASRPITKGNFAQERKMSANGRSLKSSGTFLFSLDGIIWRTQKPFPSTMIVGMTQIIQETADGRRTVIDASGNQVFASMANTLTSLFSGSISKLQENFVVNFSASGNNWKAELTPRDSTIAAVMKSITIGGTSSANDAVLSTMMMTEASGDTITYTLTDQQYPKELSNEERSAFAAK